MKCIWDISDNETYSHGNTIYDVMWEITDCGCQAPEEYVSSEADKEKRCAAQTVRTEAGDSRMNESPSQQRRTRGQPYLRRHAFLVILLVAGAVWPAVAPLSLVSVVKTAEGNTGTEIFEPPQRLTPSLFEFAEVNVQLLDAAGAPLSRGQLHCFNHNLGLFYPDRIARVILEDSKTLIHLPLGEYTMIGAAHGMIATIRTVITGDCSLVLRPDAIINIDTEGPVEDGSLFVVPSALRFLLPGYSMGPTQMPTSLAVSSDVPLDLTLWQRPPNQRQRHPVESFILRQTDVEPGTEVRLDSNKSALSQVTYGMTDSNGLACPSHNLIVVIPPGAHSTVTIPHNATQQWDELSLYVTPGRTLLRPVGLVDQRTYGFYPEIIDLKAETIYDLRVDGQFYPSVRCRPEAFLNQLLVELPSTGDWGLRRVATSDGQACGKIEFFEGRIPYEQDLFPTLGCWLEYVPKPGTAYRVTLDLGFFGSYELDGSFRQAEDGLVMTRKETEHFTVLWPDCIGDRFGEYAEYLEGAYHAISRALELEVSTKIEWSPLIVGAGGTGGSHFTTHLNYLKDPRSRDPACEHWKGAMSHELGHVFQGVSDGLVDFGGPSGTCKEALASVMRDIALQEMMADGAGLMVSLWHRENFFMTLYRRAGFLGELTQPDNPARFEEYWRYYFILSHLTDIYGPGIHGEVARAWGDPDEAKNTHRLLEAQGLGSEEIVCATYSAVVGEDLGWLFRLAEFDVPDVLVP